MVVRKKYHADGVIVDGRPQVTLLEGEGLHRRGEHPRFNVHVLEKFLPGGLVLCADDEIGHLFIQSPHHPAPGKSQPAPARKPNKISPLFMHNYTQLGAPCELITK